MSTEETLLLQLEKTVDELIANAQELKKVSSQVIVEEELAELQKKQQVLVKELITTEKDYQKHFHKSSEETKSPTGQRLRDKLQEFQKLNEAFINNINSSQGLIHFEKIKSKLEQ